MNEEERTSLANVIRSLTAAVNFGVALNEDDLKDVENLITSLRPDDGEMEKNSRERK